MRLLLGLLCALLAHGDGNATGDRFAPTGRSLHINAGDLAIRDHVSPQPLQHRRRAPDASPDSAFDLKIQVNNALSRQYLSRAVVEVYVNYTRTNAALTGEDGGVLLHVPFTTGMPISIVASKDGFICTLLPCKTNRMPIFSSVTMSLLGLNQGNIWLFDDSVLITGKTSDSASLPSVQFPKSLLNLTDGSNATSVKAFLTVPKLPSKEDSFLHTLGIVSSKSGFVSVELSPVAAVSVQLFSGDAELHVSGPVHIRLSIPDSSGLQTSNVVPAWFLNRTAGGWMRKGLGTMVSVEGKLVWTFTAPHLGYWIAAPLSSTRGFFGVAIPIDFISHHSSLLMLVLGGMLVIVSCLLVGLLFNRRRSLSGTKTKLRPAMRKDQTTSTCDGEVSDVSSADSFRLQSGPSRSSAEIANPGAAAVPLQCNEPERSADPSDLMRLRETAAPIRAPASQNLFFYNQPVAIFHAPAFFRSEEQPEQPQWSKSATLPLQDGPARVLPEGPPGAQNEDQVGVLEGSRAAASSTDTSAGRFSLTESASVPGTLNKMSGGGGGRHSAHAFADLSRIPSTQPPRAWFVSLEGKPAAEIHYAVSEQQRRRRPVESRETSLDSGVDMSELNPTAGRRAVTLERKNTFVKSSRRAPPQ
ncbi:protein FAM171B-like [Clinocottus analis]|uniref:protein FAM171B-like n=1 Tax=Clinocottus analis TaxID=304258 RepID=UPI0035BF0D07